MNLELLREQSIFEIREGLLFCAGDFSADSIGKYTQQISINSRALGCYHYITNRDFQNYAENLERAVYARLYFLIQCKSHGIKQNRFLALHKSQAILDAICVNRFDLIQQIDGLSITTWNSEWEYEDDFYYILILIKYCLNKLNDAPTYKALLDRFERSLEGDLSTRFKLTQALLENDQESFLDEISVLALEFKEQFETDRESIVSPSDIKWVNGFVQIELIALAKLYQIKNPDSRFELALLPSELLAITPPHSTDPFKAIEAAKK